MQNQSNISNIDLVLPWVDGSDPEWRALRGHYEENTKAGNEEFRFRDWNLLRYTLRSIEINLPWIRKVHFITCGQIPEWLNLKCPRLNVVFHDEYIPKKWLPTFNANTIELNIHRISELSDKFIYSNDDLFFVKPMSPADFFERDLPKSQAGLDIIQNRDLSFVGILNANMNTINRCFFSREVILKNFAKFINFKYGIKDNFKTLMLAPWCYGFFPGLSYFHGPNSYLKSTLEDVWDKEEKLLKETCSHKFRTYEDVNQYLFLWWQWCNGRFVPGKMNNKLRFIRTEKSIEILTNEIEKPKSHILCINDSETDDFEIKREAIIRSFNTLFGNKSQFEL